MTDEELKQLWQASQKRADKLHIDPPKLFTEMTTKINQFEKDIKKRNRREIVVALVLVPIFLSIAFTVPYTLSKIGAILLIFASLWITYFLKTNSGIKEEVNNSSSIKEQLQQKKQYIVREKRILETVFAWYLLPLLTGMLLFFAGFGLFSIRGIFQLFVLFIVGVSVYFLNQKAAKDLEPLLKEIETSIRQLEE